MGRENQKHGGGVLGVFTFQGSAHTWLNGKIKEIMTSSRCQRTRKWPDFRTNCFEWCRVLSQSCMVESTGWSSPFSPSASYTIWCQLCHCWVCWVCTLRWTWLAVCHDVYSSYSVLISSPWSKPHTSSTNSHIIQEMTQMSTKYILPNVYKIQLISCLWLERASDQLENWEQRCRIGYHGQHFTFIFWQFSFLILKKAVVLWLQLSHTFPDCSEDEVGAASDKGLEAEAVSTSWNLKAGCLCLRVWVFVSV